MHESALLFETLRYVGVAYLLYLAYTVWREGGRMSLDGEVSSPAAGRIISRGILINLLNPRLTIFFLAFLPQFTPADAGSALQTMLLLSALFMAMTLVVFVAYGLLASRVRDLVTRRPDSIRWAQRGVASLFAALAVQLALGER